MKIRLVDVARDAGVSTATVTRVLHDQKYISDDIRQRVMDSVVKLGYVPLRHKRVRRSNTKMLGLIAPYVYPNIIFQMMTFSVKTYAAKMGYEMVILYNDGDIEEIPYLLNTMLEIGVQGVIFTSFVEGQIPEPIFARIKASNIPMALIERPIETFGISKVLIQNSEGSYNITNYLIKNGHRDICFIGKKLEYVVEKQRFLGFKQAMDLHNLENVVEQNSFFVQEYSEQQGFEMAKHLLNVRKRPTAIFVASDILVSGVLQYLHTQKIRVPDDISIVGYDDTIASLLSPPITTVRIPFDDIARNAIDIILAHIRKEAKANLSISVSPEVIVRDSVKDIN